jgi:hypothetical protein
MKYTWKYKFDKISFLTSLVPLAIVVYVNVLEDTIFNLIISLLIGLSTLVQVFKSRQKDVITIEHNTLYKKSLFGKVQEIDLTKYKEFHLEGLSKKNAILIGFYREDDKIKRKTLLRNEYEVPLEKIKSVIELTLHQTEFTREERDLFFYQEKQEFLENDSIAQEDYKKTIRIANIIIAVCLLFVVILSLILFDNNVEAILAIILMIYIVQLFPISNRILNNEASVMMKRRYMLILYTPGLILMISLALMLFDN